jgi:hypothetical protein
MLTADEHLVEECVGGEASHAEATGDSGHCGDVGGAFRSSSRIGCTAVKGVVGWVFEFVFGR